MTTPDLDGFLASGRRDLETVGRTTIKLPEGRHKIWLFGCTHFGAPGMDIERWEAHTKQARRGHWRGVHLGDVCELVVPSWRAANTNNMMTQTMPREQLRHAANYLDRFTFDAAVQGNHDDRAVKDLGGNIWEDHIFPRLRNNTPAYLGYTGYLTYRIGRRDVVFVINHLASGGAANQANAVNRLRSTNEGGDVYAGGQNHQPYLEAKRVRTPSGARPVYYVRTGSYMYEAEYADQANYPAGGAVGSWVVTISPDGVEGFDLLT